MLTDSTAMNPARCFGLLAVTGGFEGHYVHWAAAAVAAAASGVVYIAMPPYAAGTVIDAVTILG